MKIRLDDIDFDLISELLSDASKSLNSLSKSLGLPKSTIHAKIKRLEKHGLIEKYMIKLNMNVLRYPLLAFIMVNFDQHRTDYDQETVARNLSENYMVEECHLLAGEHDILIKVRAKNIEDLGEFSTKTLKNIDGIGRSITYVVMNRIKDVNTAPYLIDGILAPHYLKSKINDIN